MINHVKTWLSLASDRRGVTALEYALIAAVIVATITAGFTTFATDLSNYFGSVGTSL
jgi:Flp pilus assembly pilin Flp